MHKLKSLLCGLIAFFPGDHTPAPLSKTPTESAISLRPARPLRTEVTKFLCLQTLSLLQAPLHEHREQKAC